ncbi:MAG TPA: serine hydrolase [Gemmatimonadaceae bacterium]|nr:serine hydrolase [Gemmatimonadaceae bacterium]
MSAGLVLLFLAEPCGILMAQSDQDFAARVDKLFVNSNRDGAPGLAVGIVRDGRVLMTKGYGLASLEYRVPITSSTTFDVASLAKQFTGLAVAVLVGQGKIALDADVRAYLPEFPDLGKRITIDHLVHHTSGLRDWPSTLSVAGWRLDDVITTDQILSMAYRQRSLNFSPGAEYSYSNTGYNLLAAIIAKVTGQPFGEWMQQNLFRPLGMAHTHFRDDYTEVISQSTSGYSRWADSTYHRVPDNLTAPGSSSLFTTVEDLSRWLINFDNPVVGGKAAQAMTRTRGVLNDGTTIPYAFGISHGDYQGVPTLSHSGSWASVGTFLLYFPQQRLGVIVLANDATIDPSRAAYQIADVFLDKKKPDAVADTHAVSSQKQAAVPRVAPALLDQYVGLYRLAPGWYVRITKEGQGLKTQATAWWGPEKTFPMTPRSENEFWVEAYRASITFERGADGHITNFHYREMRAPKVSDPPPPSASELRQLAGEYESAELNTTYRVEATDSSLILWHPHHGQVPLTRVARSDFAGSLWFLNSIDFQRDSGGKVTGFMVNAGDRSRNIWFARRR